MDAKSSRLLIIVGLFVGGLAVALGAFGAHSLETQIPKWYPDELEQIKKMATWEIGVRYQMYHALALMLFGIVSAIWKVPKVALGGWIVFAGTIVFSGSLYVIVLADISIFGLVAALGGTLLIIGWTVAGFAFAFGKPSA